MKSAVAAIAAVILIFALAGTGHAVRLLTQQKALDQILGKNLEVLKETKYLKGKALDAAKSRLGGMLIHLQEGSESREVKEKKTIDFHFAVRDGRKVGVAIFDEEPGKWGPVEFVIGLTMKGKVKKVRVMSYTEKRGRPIARRSFLGQFRGKSSRSRMTVGKDIVAIAGATVSSECAAFAVKKAIVLYEELYLKPQMLKAGI